MRFGGNKHEPLNQRKLKNMKKTRSQVKEILVREWYEERPRGIYQIMEFTNGERIERRSPYKELPWVEVEYGSKE